MNTHSHLIISRDITNVIHDVYEELLGPNEFLACTDMISPTKLQHCKISFKETKLNVFIILVF